MTIKATTPVALLSAATATGYGTIMHPRDRQATFQAYGTTSAGAGAAAIKIWASNIENTAGTLPASATDVDWVLLGTISLTLGTTQTTDGFAINAPWRWVKAEVDSISGTDATVTCVMGS